ncbi:hypothetical protein CFC35_11545 [Streptomyces sp. FBKL.4005]|nr:hypothetical protein CFC35_11545 [Streptomyces sp. FBKL.4005]
MEDQPYEKRGHADRADAALVRIRDLAGRPRGLGFLADHEGTLLTSHEAVDGLPRLVLHAAGDRTRVVTADAVTPLPALDLALVRTEGLGAEPLPLTVRERIAAGTYVQVAAGCWREARVLAATQVTYTATDGFHLLDDALELAIGTAGRDALRLGGGAAGGPVLDARTGAVVGVLGTALHSAQRDAGFAVPLRPADGALAGLLARNAATVPGYGADLNLAGILQLTTTSVGQDGPPGALEPLERAGITRELAAFTTGDRPVLALVGAPGSGRTTELAALAARRARQERPAPTLWLRGADLKDADDSVADAARRALARAARIVAASRRVRPEDLGDVTPEHLARLAARAGRPLLLVLDGPEEMPPVLAHRLPAWTRGTADWLRETGARLVVACREEHWERAGRSFPSELLHTPAGPAAPANDNGAALCGPTPREPASGATEPPLGPTGPAASSAKGVAEPQCGPTGPALAVHGAAGPTHLPTALGAAPAADVGPNPSPAAPATPPPAPPHPDEPRHPLGRPATPSAVADGGEPLPSPGDGRKRLLSPAEDTKRLLSPGEGTKRLLSVGEGTHSLLSPDEGTHPLLGLADGRKPLSGPADGPGLLSSPANGQGPLSSPAAGAPEADHVPDTTVAPPHAVPGPGSPGASPHPRIAPPAHPTDPSALPTGPADSCAPSPRPMNPHGEPAGPGEPAVLGEPAALGEPAVTGDPAAAREPAVTGDPAAARAPAATPEPAVPGEPAPSEPAPSEPAALGKPATPETSHPGHTGPPPRTPVDPLPPCLRIGDFSASEGRRARGRYGIPDGVLAERDARHPLALRLLSEVRAAVPDAPVAGPVDRDDVFAAYLDLMCLRIAVRLAAAGGLRGTAVRRLAARVAGQVHEAARRSLGPGQGELDRESFEAVFPWGPAPARLGGGTGWASAVLAEGLLVPAGGGYRFAHEELADWIQGMHLDLDEALRALVHRPGEPRGSRRPVPVPHHRVGPVVQALLVLGRQHGARQLSLRLRELVDALDRDPGSWWAARLLARTLLEVPDAAPYTEVLRLLADRVVAWRRARRPVPADFRPAFWTALPVTDAERLDLLRRLVLADPAPPTAGDRYLDAVAGLLAAAPTDVQPLLTAWFADERPLPATPHATVATAAQALLHTHRHGALEELTETLAACAHPRADELLAVLAEEEPSAVCRAADRWAHDERPARRAAAVTSGLRAAPYVRTDADRELLRRTALALLARPADRPLHGGALALLVRDPQSRDRYLPAALRHFADGDPQFPPSALVPALTTHPEPVLDAFRARLRAPDAGAAVRGLAEVTTPALARPAAALAREAARLRPEAAGHIAADVDRRLAQGATARPVLLPLVTGLLDGGPEPLRAALATVLAAPGTAGCRPLRRELLEVLLAREEDPAVLEAVLHAAVERGGGGEEEVRGLVHRTGLLLVRTPEGATRFDRGLVDLARHVPGFAARMTRWLTEAPDDWAAVVGPSTRRMIENIAGVRVPA